MKISSLGRKLQNQFNQIQRVISPRQGLNFAALGHGFGITNMSATNPSSGGGQSIRISRFLSPHLASVYPIGKNSIEVIIDPAEKIKQDSLTRNMGIRVAVTQSLKNFIAQSLGWPEAYLPDRAIENQTIDTFQLQIIRQPDAGAGKEKIIGFVSADLRPSGFGEAKILDLTPAFQMPSFLVDPNALNSYDERAKLFKRLIVEHVADALKRHWSETQDFTALNVASITRDPAIINALLEVTDQYDPEMSRESLDLYSERMMAQNSFDIRFEDESWFIRNFYKENPMVQHFKFKTKNTIVNPIPNINPSLPASIYDRLIKSPKDAYVFLGVVNMEKFVKVLEECSPPRTDQLSTKIRRYLNSRQ